MRASKRDGTGTASATERMDAGGMRECGQSVSTSPNRTVSGAVAEGGSGVGASPAEACRGLELVPMTRAEAAAFVRQHHRHHRPSVGDVFNLGAARDGAIVGVAVVGRPVARMLHNGATLEVTRLCSDGTRNVCSFLYAACWRACRALGWKRLVTYTLPSEGGASLRAAGWKLIGEAGGGSWSRPSRPRVDTAPTQAKLRWEAC